MEGEIQTKTKTKKMRILYPFHKLLNLWNKHRIHIIYLLIITNIIIWAIAYNHTTNFYDRYIYLLTKAQAGTQEVSIKDDTKVATTSKTEPQKGSYKWIKKQWKQAGADWEKVYAVIQCESRWKNNNWNVNSNGTVDVGLYMFNSLHFNDRLSLRCSTDPTCSTHKAIELWQEQGYTPWVCANTLGIKK